MIRLEVAVFLAFAVALGKTASEAQAQNIYWTDSDGRSIRRADLDGTNIEELVTRTPGFPAGIALDLSAGRMFWVESSDGDYFGGRDPSIRRGQLDGLGVATVFAESWMYPRDITLNVNEGKMYWSSGVCRGCLCNGFPSIQRADLDGSDHEFLAGETSCAPRGIALDPSAGKIYWTDWGGCGMLFTIPPTLQRANLDGSDLEILIDTDVFDPEAIALDLSAGKMYWTELATWGDVPARIRRANLDGSEIEDLVTYGLSKPKGIALDLAANKMYWTDSGTDTIRRANLDGSGIETVVSATSAGASPTGIALDLTGACCQVNGTCVDMDGTVCVNQGGNPGGAGTVCDGDQDGDGLDRFCGDDCPNDPHKTSLGICGCGVDDSLFAPECLGIPTVSVWGMIVLTLLLLTAGKVCFTKYRREAQ